MKKIRIGVIFGGRSGEHEVSLVSAQSIIKNLPPSKYEVVPIGITKTGKWLSGADAVRQLKNGNVKNLLATTLNSEPEKHGIIVLGKNNHTFRQLDVIFPVLHGPYGEDGTIQGMLELADIPYVGCGVFASSACMDKFMAKTILKAYGISQADFLHFTRSEINKNAADVSKEIMKKIGLPCFVKPSNLGSSVGISKVKKVSELAAALTMAASYDSSIIIEKAIDAREIECAVLGNEEPIASIAGEIVPSREFYDFYAKYVDNKSESLIPAPISTKKMKEVQALAIEAYKAMQCSSMARVDFLMDKKTGKLYLNELNTIPGFTSISMYPKLWEASGIKYGELIDRLIELAFDRHREKQKNKITFESGSDWYK